MKLFQAYRVLAFVVGVLLAFCALVAAPLKYLAAEGSDLQQFGESASILWVLHGWVFMIYVVVAVLLARKARDELLARVDGLLCQDAARYGDVLGAASALVSGDELRAAADRIATVLQ